MIINSHKKPVVSNANIAAASNCGRGDSVKGKDRKRGGGGGGDGWVRGGEGESNPLVVFSTILLARHK